MPAMDHKPVSNCLMIRCTNGHLVTQAHQNDFDVSGKKKMNAGAHQKVINIP